VVRLYESRGGRGEATVRFGFAVAGIEPTDLLERPLPTPGVAVDGEIARLALRPFQIVTLRVRRA
jgi:alpha-mannosidase